MDAHLRSLKESFKLSVLIFTSCLSSRTEFWNYILKRDLKAVAENRLSYPQQNAFPASAILSFLYVETHLSDFLKNQKE